MSNSPLKFIDLDCGMLGHRGRFGNGIEIWKIPCGFLFLSGIQCGFRTVKGNNHNVYNAMPSNFNQMNETITLLCTVSQEKES